MILDVVRGRPVNGVRSILPVVLGVLLVLALSIIPTSFAVPGQQTEVLVHQGAADAPFAQPNRQTDVTLGLPSQAGVLTRSVAPSNPRVLYLATAQYGLFRSDDGGQNYTSINQGLPKSLGIAPVTPVRHLAVDPTNPDVAYASTEVNGIYKTTDGGTSWKPISDGLPGLFSHRTYQPLLLHHPTESGVVYAVLGYPVHSHLVENKLYKTTDGEHWIAIANLPSNHLFTKLELVNADLLQLAVTYDGGVIHIKDEGQQVDSGPYWKPMPTPLRAGATVNTDIGEIAVIEDDGTLNQNFDLQGRTIEFIPTAQSGYAIISLAAQFESELGTAVTLTDNGSASQSLPFPFSFYGTARHTLFVNANGNITFERADPTADASAVGTFAQFRLGQPRIAGLWTDFNPSVQGSVHIKAATDPSRLVVTWSNVRVASVPSVLADSSTIQIVLFSDGRIRFNYGTVVSALGGLVGLSPGSSRASPLMVNFSRDLPQTVDNRAVLEFFPGRGLDIQAVARKFYETRGDHYDQLVVFTSGGFRTNMTGVAGALAYHRLVRNDITGIGQSVGEFLGGPQAYGSGGRLQSFINMNRLNFYPNNPDQVIGATITPLDAIGHETAHRWLSYYLYENNGNPAFNLLTLDFTHWSFFFNSDASLMYGNQWQENGDGTFTSVDATSRYGVLDEYAMGLRPPADVKSIFFVSQANDPDGRTRNNLPEVGVTVRGVRADISLEQIIALNGPRVPAFGSAPTRLRQAYVLVIPEGSSPAMSEVNKLDRFRREFEPYFNQLTSRRAVVDTRLMAGQPDLVVETVGIDPPVVRPGEVAALSFTLRNRGTAAAGMTVHEIRLSSDSKLEAGDPTLKRIPTMSLMPAEGATLLAVPVLIPTTATAGPQFVILAVDGGNAAAESDEANNVVAIPVTVMGDGLILTAVREVEPNDRLNQATPITPDALVTAEIGSSRDVDFYSFTARGGQALTIDINARSLMPPSSANTVVTLLDSAGNTLAENDDFAGSFDSYLSLLVPRDGRYFVRVRDTATTPMNLRPPYQMLVILRTARSVAEVEPNDTPETAMPITPDVLVSGAFDKTGDQDFLIFSAGAGQTLTVDVDAQSLVDASAADTLVTLFNLAGSVLAENDDFGESSDSFLQVTIPRAGQYLIRLRDLASRGGPGFTYRVAVRLSGPPSSKQP
ncbi:MAG: pre-peptidase C-terminal domain-containing protein [Acidobacteriota bacterium]|nr:pre-peptidase C-terminal domain-containing protein [Blastocatellia bacterium]MDW8238265.1 pre-peptidase C-terminal domain-containing protein [Acidobacteriota bacterium]